jgi:hypothetical protein
VQGVICYDTFSKCHMVELTVAQVQVRIKSPEPHLLHASPLFIFFYVTTPLINCRQEVNNGQLIDNYITVSLGLAKAS